MIKSTDDTHNMNEIIESIEGEGLVDQAVDSVWEIFWGDFALFIGGASFGLILGLFLVAKILKDINISPNMRKNKDLNMIVVQHDDGRELTYWNPHTFRQTVRLIPSFIAWKYFRKEKGKYMLHHEKKASILFCILLVFLLIVTIIAIYNLITIQIYVPETAHFTKVFITRFL